jgi:hypothetical protein
MMYTRTTTRSWIVRALVSMSLSGTIPALDVRRRSRTSASSVV